MNVSIMKTMTRFMTLFDETLLLSLLSVVVVVNGQRYCYECTGFQCMQNPLNPELFPGRVKCHEVMEFCTTHVRYEPFQNTTDSVSKVERSLKATDYGPTSATRSCAKVWLGNTCRRDWLGPPLITCMSTCDTDFCNCDTRSPPAEMFRSGKVLPLSPKGATYGPHDLLSCGHMAGTGQKSTRLDDDYSYYNDYEMSRKRTNERRKIGHKRRKSKHNSSNTVNRMLPFVHFLSGLILISTMRRKF